jgi:nucleotide-binding universal stress UspA family protein
MLLAAEDALARLSREIIDDTVKRGLDGAPAVTIEPVVSPRSAAVALLHEAAEAQLLVVGRRGHGGFSDLALGSVSHQCMSYAACTTAIIRTEQPEEDE